MILERYIHTYIQVVYLLAYLRYIYVYIGIVQRYRHRLCCLKILYRLYIAHLYIYVYTQNFFYKRCIGYTCTFQHSFYVRIFMFSWKMSTSLKVKESAHLIFFTRRFRERINYENLIKTQQQRHIKVAPKVITKFESFFWGLIFHVPLMVV